MGPAHWPFIIQLKSSSSLMEKRLVKEIHKRPKMLAGIRKEQEKEFRGYEGGFQSSGSFLGGI